MRWIFHADAGRLCGQNIYYYLRGKHGNSCSCNIAMAVENFKNRGYAGLGGLILNRRDVPREEEKVAELADDFHTAVIGTLSHSGQVALAEEQKKTLMERYPTGEMADEYRALAMQMYRICGGILEAKIDKVRSGYIQEEA